MSIYAVIDQSGLIVNVINWDGEAEWTPPENMTAVECGDENCQIGGRYSDGKFTLPDVPEPTKEELISAAENTKTALMADAGARISVLQDAVDLEMATDDEVASLAAWKKYRVLLNRVDTSKAPDITWPAIPA